MASSIIQPSPAIGDFLKFLLSCGIDGTRGLENEKYIPSLPLKDYLRLHIKDLLQAVSSDQLHRATHIVDSYSQVFAILITIHKGAFIDQFTVDGLSDIRLPFKTDPGFPLEDDFFHEFQQQQWRFCAPKLNYLFNSAFGDDCILPFQLVGEPIAWGNSCKVYKINTAPEYDSLCPPSTLQQKTCPLLPAARILKVFKNKSEFLQEKKAFTTLLKDGKPPEHLIEYLGSYEQDNILCIILEYADLGSLDDYFGNTIPPTSEVDIIAFFASLFELVKGLISIHEVGETLVGWHEDIKPANILALSKPTDSKYDCLFKISDFVTSHFKPKESGGGEPISKSISFARTYAPPECWRNEDKFQQQRTIIITQTVDIWALGCVFLEAMVWLSHGWSGLDKFRNDRLEATKCIEGFKDGNCFHDGWTKLQVVDDWLELVVNEGRKTDNISPSLAHLVREMLDENPEYRPNTKRLFHSTQQYIGTAKNKLQLHQTNSPSNSQLQRPPQTPTQPPSFPTHGRGHSQSQSQTSYRQQPSPRSSFVMGSSQPPSPFDDNEGRNSPQLRSRVSSGPSNGYEISPQRQNGASSDRTHSFSDPANSDGNSPSVPISPSQLLSAEQARINQEIMPVNGKLKEKLPIPHWPVKAAVSWREDRKEQSTSEWNFSRIIGKECEQNKFADVEGSTHLMELKDRDHIIVIDDSISMKSHKFEVATMVDLLGYCLKGFDPDGVEMFLSVARKKYKSSHSKRLKKRLGNSSFKAPCNMAHYLGQIFEDYKEKIRMHTHQYHDHLTPMNIYILTNAVWLPVCEVEDQIVSFVKFLEERNIALRQVGIQFIRFGDNEEGKRRLELLDKLKSRNRTQRDIVDEEHCTGNFFKMLLGSINPLFDDDGDQDSRHGSERS